MKKQTKVSDPMFTAAELREILDGPAPVKGERRRKKNTPPPTPIDGKRLSEEQARGVLVAAQDHGAANLLVVTRVNKRSVSVGARVYQADSDYSKSTVNLFHLPLGTPPDLVHQYEQLVYEYLDALLVDREQR